MLGRRALPAGRIGTLDASSYFADSTLATLTADVNGVTGDEGPVRHRSAILGTGSSTPAGPDTLLSGLRPASRGVTLCETVVSVGWGGCTAGGTSPRYAWCHRNVTRSWRNDR
jgi:hypothetical protein